MDHTKVDQADLDFPCRELSVRGLGFAVALLVHSGIGFLSACIGWQSSCIPLAVWVYRSRLRGRAASSATLQLAR